MCAKKVKKKNQNYNKKNFAQSDTKKKIWFQNRNEYNKVNVNENGKKTGSDRLRSHFEIDKKKLAIFGQFIHLKIAKHWRKK